MVLLQKTLQKTSLEEDFMQIITTYAMAAHIKAGIIHFPNGVSQKEYYYISSTRIKMTQLTERNDCGFLEIKCVNFFANLQACICHTIMTDDCNDVILIATEEHNISCS